MTFIYEIDFTSFAGHPSSRRGPSTAAGVLLTFGPGGGRHGSECLYGTTYTSKEANR